MGDARHHPLTARYAAGRYGAAIGPGVTFARRQPAAMLLVGGVPEPLAEPGARRSHAAPRHDGTAVERPLAGKPVRFLPIAPDTWLAVSEELGPDALRAAVTAGLGRGYLTDMSDARSLIEMSGPGTGVLLAKACSVPLAAIGTGGCVASVAAGVPVLIHRAGAEPRLHLYVPRSFAVSLWEWLTQAAAELGYRVLD